MAVEPRENDGSSGHPKLQRTAPKYLHGSISHKQ
jgi:hypothetical protein